MQPSSTPWIYNNARSDPSLILLTKFKRSYPLISPRLQHFSTFAIMNISYVLILVSLAIQASIVLADYDRRMVGSGKPDHGASRRGLGDGSTSTTSSKSHKSSKSTDSPTLFPTVSQVLLCSIIISLSLYLLGDSISQPFCIVFSQGGSNFVPNCVPNIFAYLLWQIFQIFLVVVVKVRSQMTN